MKKPSDQLIFPIIVAALSVFNLLRNFQEFHVSSVAISVIGLIGVSLFFLNKKGTEPLFYIWITSQLITYINSDIAIVTNQLPDIHLGLTFNSKSSLLIINFVPLFYFIGYRLLIAFNIINKSILIGPIKVDSNLKSSEGIIKEYINLGQDGKWYRVETSGSENLFIKPKEGGERISNKKSILVYVKKYNSETRNYQFIDWGKAKLK